MDNDFIGIYDNEEKPFSVTSVVTWFINNYNTTKTKESGLSYFNRHRKRICTSKTLDFGEDYEGVGDFTLAQTGRLLPFWASGVADSAFDEAQYTSALGGAFIKLISPVS